MCNGGTKCECDGADHCLGNLGSGCNTGNQCLSGNCVDGVCCNFTCSGACRACTAALTGGIDGNCGEVKSGMTHDNGANKCDGMTGCHAAPCACNGTGACLDQNGSGESVAANCLSGFVADNVCCNVACTDACQGCRNGLTGGTTGICGNVTKGTTHAGKCDATTAICGAGMMNKPCACDGMDVCLGAATAPCDAGMNAECVNGTCTAMTNVCN